MNSLEKSIAQILERNKKVEADKAWEVSLTRRSFIVLLTFITASALLWVLDQPLIGALIPAAGYVLSTLSLPWIKKWWVEKQKL